MAHDPPMDGSSEPYVVRFFSRSSPDPAPVLTRFQPGAMGRALGAAVFIAVVLGPPAVAIYAIMSVASIDVRPGGAGVHGFWDDIARQLDFLLK